MQVAWAPVDIRHPAPGKLPLRFPLLFLIFRLPKRQGARWRTSCFTAFTAKAFSAAPSSRDFPPRERARHCSPRLQFAERPSAVPCPPPQRLPVGGSACRRLARRPACRMEKKKANPGPLGLFGFAFTTALLQGGVTTITGAQASAAGAAHGSIDQLSFPPPPCPVTAHTHPQPPSPCRGHHQVSGLRLRDSVWRNGAGAGRWVVVHGDMGAALAVQRRCMQVPCEPVGLMRLGHGEAPRWGFW